MEVSWRDYFAAIMFWIMLGILLFNPHDVEKEHEERGITVVATVTELEKSIRNRESYKCTYYNEKGELVEAMLTPNKFNVEIGQTLERKYLPETPGHVYCKAAGWIKILLILMALYGGLYYPFKIYYYKKHGEIPWDEYFLN